MEDKPLQQEPIDEVINKTQNLQGIDLIYFLNKNYEIVKEKRKSNAPDYLEQITNILKLGPGIENISQTFHSKSFQTLTLLNESGLIVISRLNFEENLYMVIIAGENEPVDLMALLKICKEAQSGDMLVAGD